MTDNTESKEIQDEMSEDKKSWNNTYRLVMVVLAIQILLYYLFTTTFS